ncbi:hypothetical protein AQUCO_00700947v1 [Aquilegia coerulea]|uniref:Uncharacterized protein n=1 Tax=Aquilegia coerulea TaxID=218851 RepID=A0A2G5EMH7_AQUCA|nr:hypothetical protein AQUCO_00700947v1 [Aquilegia coerulea]
MERLVGLRPRRRLQACDIWELYARFQVNEFTTLFHLKLFMHCLSTTLCYYILTVLRQPCKHKTPSTYACS